MDFSPLHTFYKYLQFPNVTFWHTSCAKTVILRTFIRNIHVKACMLVEGLNTQHFGAAGLGIL